MTARVGRFPACFCVTTLFAQPAGPPAFEVASTKPSLDPPGSVVGIFETKGRIRAKNVTLKRCIRGVTVPAGDHDLILMLQTLLADRFKLVLTGNRGLFPATG
jgi:hypothetical protein